MIDHNMVAISESEEMYLITIAQLVERGVDEPVSISRLAGELAIQPVSANQMVHKLSEEGYVEYIPYKGVQLTQEGQAVALQVLRDRRLWEVFLVEYLELPPSDADALACRLEHITPKGVTCRLARFLDHPSFTPKGLPIPEIEGDVDLEIFLPITNLAVGERGEIMRIEADQATWDFLSSVGLGPGLEVYPVAKGVDGAMLLQVDADRIHLSETVANHILVNVKERSRGVS